MRARAAGGGERGARAKRPRQMPGAAAEVVRVALSDGVELGGSPVTIGIAGHDATAPYLSAADRTESIERCTEKLKGWSAL